MQKAYEIGGLLEKLKEKGLNVGEEVAKEVFVAVMSWVEESAVLSENKIDDLVVGLVAPLKGYVLTQIDKIDGAVG